MSHEIDPLKEQEKAEVLALIAQLHSPEVELSAETAEAYLLEGRGDRKV